MSNQKHHFKPPFKWTEASAYVLIIVVGMSLGLGYVYFLNTHNNLQNVSSMNDSQSSSTIINGK